MRELAKTSDDSFKSDVLDAERPVLVDFYADWCGPCRALLPALVDIANEYDGEVSVVKLNIDENQIVREQFGIRGIPALILFNRGVEKDRLLGVVPRSSIALAIEAVMDEAA